MTLVLLSALAAYTVFLHVYFHKKFKKLEQKEKVNTPAVLDSVGARSMFSIMYGNP